MRSRASAALLVATLAATAAVYGRLISTYFVRDDFLNLFAVVDADRFEYLLRPHGGHLLVVRNACFVLFHWLFGMQAELYFAAVLLTHLLNTLLLFRIVDNWTESAPLAAFGALLWATSPVHAGTLGWYSVYGQVLVGTCLLIILYQISRHDRRQTSPAAIVVIGWPLLFIVASTCFGVGIGLTLVSPLALYLLLPPSRVRLAVCAALALLAAVTPSAYKALILYHQSLVTARAVNDSVALALAIAFLTHRATIAQAFAALLAYGVSSMVLGFGSAAASFPSVAAAIAVIGYVLVTSLGLWLAPRRVRLRMLGLSCFAAGAYAIIAAGRASFLHDAVTAAATARYHYVGMIPLSLLLCCALAQLTRWRRTTVASQYAVLALAVLTGGILYARATPFLDPHANARNETRAVVARIRAVIDASPRGAEVRIENRPFNSAGLLLHYFDSGFPGWAGIFALFFPTDVVDGKPVRFVIHDPAVFRLIASGRRSQHLFALDPNPAPSPPRPPPHGAR